MIEIKTVNAALLQATKDLANQSDSARLDAEVLLAFAMKKTRTQLFAYPDDLLTKTQWHIFKHLVNQRRQGRPVAYLTGSREFWSLPLKVCEDTLIPRPETELLVELALSLLINKPQAKILDLGTGSGAIALACAFERPDWHITACDCSLPALQTAQENATRLGLTTINFCQSNWFTAIDSHQRFDAILSNPPYIAAHDPHLTQGDLRYEPALALVSGPDGLTAIQHIIKGSLARLQPDGLLLFEHGFDQKFAVESMLNNYGYKNVRCWQDLQGNYRVSGGQPS